MSQNDNERVTKLIDELSKLDGPESFKNGLSSVRASCLYTAPECMWERWNEVVLICENHLNTVDKTAVETVLLKHRGPEQSTCSCQDDRHDLCLNKEHCQCQCHKYIRIYHRGVFNWTETRDALRGLNCNDAMIEKLIGTEAEDAIARRI